MLRLNGWVCAAAPQSIICDGGFAEENAFNLSFRHFQIKWRPISYTKHPTACSKPARFIYLFYYYYLGTHLSIRCSLWKKYLKVILKLSKKNEPLLHFNALFYSPSLKSQAWMPPFTTGNHDCLYFPQFSFFQTFFFFSKSQCQLGISQRAVENESSATATGDW